MEIKQLKKELNLNNSDIAKLFNLNPIVYANSSAKKRYEAALCSFYELVKTDIDKDEVNKVRQYLLHNTMTIKSDEVYNSIIKILNSLL